MKKILIFALCVMCLCGCSREPSILEVENETYNTVEALFNELVMENLDGMDMKVKECRIDRYFLYEHPDDLTYKGTLKGTISAAYFFDYDSVKVYKPVTIKFLDKKYKHYAVQIGEIQ